MLVVTLESRGVQVFDGRSAGSDRWFDVTPIPVEGTTVGCGDAFIAWFLAEYWQKGDLAAAVERGKLGGGQSGGARSRTRPTARRPRDR
jgi:sugar/nucleoside kinase (ribokinase family)